MKGNIIILLTACIDPNGMAFTAIQDRNERLEQYKAALQWYLDNTVYPILFVENTNYDITPFFRKYVETGRLEVLTFDGNNYDKSIGKGYGEALIIEYGIMHSKTLQPESVIVKITGRLIAHGINRIISKSRIDSKSVYADWVEYEPKREVIANSQFIVAPVKFYTDYFLPKKHLLNDSEVYFFEHLLRDSIIDWEKDGNCFKELLCSPQIEGFSGSQGIIYKPSFKKQIRHFVGVKILHPLGYFGPIRPIKIYRRIMQKLKL